MVSRMSDQLTSRTPEQSLIVRRRGQMLIHSYIYYHLHTNIISDDQWQTWANELVSLQMWHGYDHEFYDDVFMNWTGDTGCHLPTDDYVSSTAEKLLRYHQTHVVTPEANYKPPEEVSFF
jgi:hypothetical protein